MSIGDRICVWCGKYNCNGHDLSNIFTMTYPNYKIRTDCGDIDQLWRVRMALTEIGWAARCQIYKSYSEKHAAIGMPETDWRIDLIGTGGDTA